MYFAPFQLIPWVWIQGRGDTGAYSGICLPSEERCLLLRMYGEYLSSCWQSEEHLWRLHTAEFLSQFREFITRESSRRIGRLLFWRPQFHYFKNEDAGPAWTTWSLRSPLQWTLWPYGWLTFRVGSSLWLKESTSNILFRCFPGMLRSENSTPTWMCYIACHWKCFLQFWYIGGESSLGLSQML